MNQILEQIALKAAIENLSKPLQIDIEDMPSNLEKAIHRIGFQVDENITWRQVSGDSMIGDKIEEGDLLGFSTATATDGDIALIELNGTEFVKKLKITGSETTLISSNHKYKNYKLDSNINFQIKGKLKYILKMLE